MSFRPPVPRPRKAIAKKAIGKPKAGPVLAAKTPARAPAKPCK